MSEELSGGIGFLGILIWLAVLVFSIIVMWRLFEKAGQHGWASLIPFYNAYVGHKIAWGNGWLMLLMLIPLVNAVFGIMTVFRLAKVFGKGVGFGFGLLFLGVIFLPILAFGSARYTGVPGKTSPYADGGYQNGGYQNNGYQNNGYQQNNAYQNNTYQQNNAYQQNSGDQRGSYEPQPASGSRCPYCGAALDNGTKFC